MNASASRGQAPSSAQRTETITGNVSHSNTGGANAPRAPGASCQAFRGRQVFAGTVTNINTSTGPVAGSQHPLQSFSGKQEFQKEVTNTNKLDTAGPGGKQHFKMEDIGDGIRVGVPLQHFDGDQVFRDDVTNNNSVKSNNNNYMSGNVGRKINGSPNVAGPKAAISVNVPAHPVYTLDDSSSSTDSLLPPLQSFTGGQQFHGDVWNNNMVNSNSNNYKSGNVCSNIRGSNTFAVNGVKIGGRKKTSPKAAPEPRSKNGTSWTKRLFRNPLQRFDGSQQFKGEVTNNNSINSNNNNVMSGNYYVG